MQVGSSLEDCPALPESRALPAAKVFCPASTVEQREGLAVVPEA
jgi:hypothetical protein